MSAWSIDQYLATYTTLPPLGHAFKQAEAKYGVNALYLLAHAMHETGFGTSFIARAYHNLFGWSAYDRDPTGLATRFRTYAQSIDYVAEQIAEVYLSPTGKHYGGAPTLRGMHRYASDPKWAMLIARIANGISFSTLARRGVSFDQPIVGALSAGRTATVKLTTRAGNLPDHLHIAYRFVPVAVVEASAPTGAAPDPDPEFKLASGTSHKGAFQLRLTSPTRPGRYRLELRLRDSDGSVLTEFGLPRIASTAVRVRGADAVAYDLHSTANGLRATVTNVGRRTIPASTVSVIPPDGLPSGATILTATVVAEDGTSTVLARLPLDRTLSPNRSWTATLPAPDADSLPAILVLRLEIGGSPKRLGGSPPAVFRMSAGPGGSTAVTPATAPAATSAPGQSTAGPTAAPTAGPTDAENAANSVAAGNAGASDDPTATDEAAAPGDPAATNDGSSPPSSQAPNAPTTIVLSALTPTDPASLLFLHPDVEPVASRSTPGRTTSTGKHVLPVVTSVTRSGVRLSYAAMLDASRPGAATIRLRNSGRVTLVGVVGAHNAAASTDSAAASSGGSNNPSAPDGAVLVVTAIPAWGPATAPIILTVPLIDLAPGRDVDVSFVLPSGAPSTYLVVARVLPGAGHAPFAPTVFWLWSGPLPK